MEICIPKENETYHQYIERILLERKMLKMKPNIWNIIIFYQDVWGALMKMII